MCVCVCVCMREAGKKAIDIDRGVNECSIACYDLICFKEVTH